jgi:lipopolysaccharide/colanic/teichoic acid biosynthesis glycosyltransferase
VLAAAALLIRLESPGHPIYRQRRVGRDGRPFEVYKLRTMVTGAERMGAGLAVDEGDARITRVGAVLRRTSIDELPNLINVLRGEMSLVGPRPLPVRDYERLEEWHRRRYNVLPGMTGLWQVAGRADLTFDDLVRLDFYYIENWSIWLDISILLKTPFAVFTRKGAY